MSSVSSLTSPSIHLLHVEALWFDYLFKGIKTVEGRLKRGKYAGMKVGDIVWFADDKIEMAPKFALSIVALRLYPSFEEMLEVEGIGKALPGIKSIEEGSAIYERFYSKSAQNECGVIAIEVGFVDGVKVFSKSQGYSSML
jgi:ASC-1-like (ASCH) protein